MLRPSVAITAPLTGTIFTLAPDPAAAALGIGRP
jgi:hypothetical protein